MIEQRTIRDDELIATDREASAGVVDEGILEDRVAVGVGARQRTDRGSGGTVCPGTRPFESDNPVGRWLTDKTASSAVASTDSTPMRLVTVKGKGRAVPCRSIGSGGVVPESHRHCRRASPLPVATLRAAMTRSSSFASAAFARRSALVIVMTLSSCPPGSVTSPTTGATLTGSAAASRTMDRTSESEGSGTSTSRRPCRSRQSSARDRECNRLMRTPGAPDHPSDRRHRTAGL